MDTNSVVMAWRRLSRSRSSWMLEIWSASSSRFCWVLALAMEVRHITGPGFDTHGHAITDFVKNNSPLLGNVFACGG